MTEAPTTSLWPRLQRILPYFSPSWGFALLAVLASIAAALTEPLIPALFKPLLDKGFEPDGFPLWMIPVALVLLFLFRGSAHFVGQYALTRIANDGVERLRKQRTASIPDGRYAEPEEVARLMVYLASDLASHITGQGIQINGGSHA